ncbi:MAG: hypothetical protein CEN89_261 [Candidatus Berkelbacteria bacterium Licking1014_7]|uniref:Small ribosomal subunit protein bS6 n=1 Tax=Candidatus Berkelbacteria bacterium Licking1014_7 TaxID=2017147 RepID=A0A554LJT9_9BACT|nr:MAG: hypothetical protein CEN89_261 [Candidatus Berkelbacteria bacterium Licking1014_7]
MQKLYEINALCQDKISFENISKEISQITPIKKEQDFGQKKLHFPIKKQINGFLQTFWIEADHKQLNLIEKTLKSQPEILRFLILAIKESALNEQPLSQKLAERKAHSQAAQKPKKKIFRKMEIKPEKTAVKTEIKKPAVQTAITDTAKTSDKTTPAKPIEPKDTQKRLEELDKKLAQILKE